MPNQQAQQLVNEGSVQIAKILNREAFAGEGETATALRGKALDLMAKIDTLATMFDDIDHRTREVGKVKDALPPSGILKYGEVLHLESLPQKPARSGNDAVDITKDAGNIAGYVTKKGTTTRPSSIEPSVTHSEREDHNRVTEEAQHKIAAQTKGIQAIPKLDELVKGTTGKQYPLTLSAFDSKDLASVFQSEDFTESRAYSNLDWKKSGTSMLDMTREKNDYFHALHAPKDTTHTSKAEPEPAKKEDKPAPAPQPVSGGGGGGGGRMGGGGMAFGGGGMAGGGRTPGRVPGAGGAKPGIDVERLGKDLAGEEEIDIDKMLEDMLKENADAAADTQDVDVSPTTKGIYEATKHMDAKDYNILYGPEGDPIGYSTSDAAYLFDPVAGDPVALDPVAGSTNAQGTVFTNPATGEQFRIVAPDADTGEQTYVQDSLAHQVADATGVDYDQVKRPDDAVTTTSQTVDPGVDAPAEATTPPAEPAGDNATDEPATEDTTPEPAPESSDSDTGYDVSKLFTKL